MVRFVVVTVAYGLLFVIAELLAARYKPSREVARKFGHILGGAAAALLPFVLTYDQIAILGLVMVPAVFFSRRLGIFKAVHGVQRSTHGEIYFPLAIALCAILFPHDLLFVYGVLVIGVADALASLFGQRYGHKKYHVFGGHKSYLGSLVFFMATFTIGFLLIPAFTHTQFITAAVWSAILAAALTCVEAGSHKGLDNLFVPLVACALMAVLLSFNLIGQELV